MNSRSFFLCVSALLCATTFSACSISDRWVHSDSEGVVPETFFSSVKRNKTEKNWVLDNLGVPHSVQAGPHNEEIMTYQFKRTRYREARLLVVLRYDGSFQDTQYYHLVVCDDTVKKAWWDTLAEVQVKRVTRNSKCGKSEDEVLALQAAENEMTPSSTSDNAMMSAKAMPEDKPAEIQSPKNSDSPASISVEIVDPVVTTEDAI